jgi:hypothetical protein
MSAARDTAPQRRHGVPRNTGGLHMQPPGSGGVAYPGSPARAARTSRLIAGVDAVTAALAATPGDATKVGT